MLTYYFKLYRHKRNYRLHRQIDIACEIYNRCIRFQSRCYSLFKRPVSAFDLNYRLTKWRRRYPDWDKLNAQAAQQISDRVSAAFKSFFVLVQNKKHACPPQTKKREDYSSFTLKQTGWQFPGGNAVVINKTRYRYHKSRDMRGTIKSVTIKRDNLGDIYMSVTCDTDMETKRSFTSEKAVGLDFGLKTFLTTSGGERIEAPLPLKQNLQRLRTAQKAFRSKQDGSGNRERARLELARIHRYIADCRRDWHFKLARELCSRYDIICLESLDIRDMTHRWGRKIADLGHARFVEILSFIARKTNKQVVFIDRFVPTSKICSVCGCETDKLPLSVREWECPLCGTFHDRDINAAKNILTEGMKTYSKERCA